MSREKEKKEKIGNKTLFNYLDNKNLSLRQFSLLSNISYSSLYPIYRQERMPLYRLAKRICKHTNGELTLKDFCIDE